MWIPKQAAPIQHVFCQQLPLSHGPAGNKDPLTELLADTEAKIVVITTTPYEEISIPCNAKNVIVTFGNTPSGAQILAGILYGKIHAEGIWPVEHHA